MPDDRHGDPGDRDDAAPAGAAATAAETHDRGMARRREVLGDAHVDRATARRTPFDAEFQDFITRYAWGEVWSRDGLDDRTRHLIVLALMAGLGREGEFDMHVRATRQTGVTPDELREVLHLVAIYAGLPTANTAFARAKAVFAEADADARGG